MGQNGQKATEIKFHEDSAFIDHNVMCSRLLAQKYEKYYENRLFRNFGEIWKWPKSPQKWEFSDRIKHFYRTTQIVLKLAKANIFILMILTDHKAIYPHFLSF